MFAELQIERHFYPQSYLQYIPSHCNDEKDRFKAMGIITIDDVNDNTELFVNYYDHYDLDIKDTADWLTIPESPLDQLWYLKKGYELHMTYLTNKALKQFQPKEIREKNDIEIAVTKRIETAKQKMVELEDNPDNIEAAKKLDK